MIENLKKNLTPWLLALLLLCGVIYHISKADKLYQQIATLQQEAERYKAQANGLNDRLTEIQNEIATMKASQGNLVQEAQSLRIKYQELEAAAESNEEISDSLKYSDVEASTRAIETKLAETGKGISAVENKLNNVSQQAAQQKAQTSPQPVKETHPAGASAICRDGTYSYSQNRRGTCSHHGGVARWLY